MRLLLKTDALAKWIETEWSPGRTESDLRTIWVNDACVHLEVLGKFDRNIELKDGYVFAGCEPLDAPMLTRITQMAYQGELTYQTGAFAYRFVNENKDETVEIAVASAFYSDEGYDIVTMACIPDSFLPVWTSFAHKCDRLGSPESEVTVVGGRTSSYKATVEWDEIVLPADLKQSILDDVASFFDKGAEVYKRLNLKPFRKLLLAGVPGTGKTMLCTALARRSLGLGHKVVYISSADNEGAKFWKIQHALMVAARSERPALIILEEIDAYLREEEKALVLNVLDGAEAIENEKGTLMLATTNYPEAIDERVLKRPGRLDRIFIIPEIEEPEHAEEMMRMYLGAMWHDDHTEIAREMVGYPGAFIREVAVYALTQVAHGDMKELPPELLETSFNRLRDQIEKRNEFLARRTPRIWGFQRGKQRREQESR